MDKQNLYKYIPEKMEENIEVIQNTHQSILSVIEQQNRINECMEPVLKQQEIIRKMIPENISTAVIEVDNPMLEIKPVLANVDILDGVGKIAMNSVIPNYQFESPAIKSFIDIGNNIMTNIVTGLTTLIQSSVMREIQAFTSTIGQWLQTVDFMPLINILQDFQTFGFEYDYEEIDEIFLKAMADARWFPYAGWIADFRIVGDLIDILNTSRVSKNRVKRIDSLIFSYYDKEEVNNFKRRWRQMNLPSYMTRILVQAVQAYHRREYALTVSALVTLWEGIIQEKAKDESFRKSGKTRENLEKLIAENEFNEIFSSFCDEFIFYKCMKAEDVKPDVPGRHGIAHCWYDVYPSRKMALNAILFTDFLLELKPTEKDD